VSGRPLRPLKWYRETYTRDGYRCVYCRRDMALNLDNWLSIEVDHIVPISKGGSDDLNNRVTTCNVCNRLKGNYVPDGFQNMKRSELIKQIRTHVLSKREKWKDRFDQAMIEFQTAYRLNKDS